MYVRNNFIEYRIDKRLNYTGKVALKVPAFTCYSKCAEYDDGSVGAYKIILTFCEK